MKHKLTHNLGLKLLSVLAAFFLWLLVVNVDDPVISRTYTNIPVEVVNENVIEDEGKCYEVLDNTNMINVVVTAKRSVVDQMSRDYIKATADFASMTFLDRIPIEVRSIRYSDQIESVSSRTEYLKIELEDVVEKYIPVEVNYIGEVAAGYKLADIITDKQQISVKGPESLVNIADKAAVLVDITNVEKDVVVPAKLAVKDVEGDDIDDDRMHISDENVSVSFMVNGVKEIPISCGYSGNPVGGYVVSGTIMTSPSSVRITGRGENYEDMDVIYISPDAVSVEGAMANVELTVDISDYLPSGVEFADDEFVPVVQVDVPVEGTQHKTISVPLSNITIENLPEGYIASVVDIGGTVDVEIQGLGDTYDRFNGDLAIGAIDASTLVPRTIIPEQQNAPLQTGECDGVVVFDMPIGISVVSPVNLMVVVDYVGDNPLVHAGAVETMDGNETLNSDDGATSAEITNHLETGNDEVHSDDE